MTLPSDARLSSLDRMLDESQVGDTFATDMFAVVDALEASPTLRRAVTDPGTPEGARRALVHGLLDGKVDRAVADLVAEAATLRWAGGRTFAAALERQAVRAQLIVADRRGELEDTEDQLFRFARLVESSPDLRNVLADRSVDRSGRQELVGELLRGRATESTTKLAKRAVAARERTFGHTIEGYVTLAAAQKNRVVATVRVAKPLSSDQRDRLRAALTKQIGREVAIQEVMDPDILGGVRVELGDEVFEGTVADRLEEARRLFG
ncbi:MAG TPA: F0F1 ATP synthase subunit delta [Propionibacteriaceae bacterium]|nr:F0F1 ATP synthase subunit delta [Propionibacteriaceae bacterium]